MALSCYNHFKNPERASMLSCPGDQLWENFYVSHKATWKLLLSITGVLRKSESHQSLIYLIPF